MAIAALVDEGLPRTPSPGLSDAVGKGSLVPSEGAEQAQLVAATASELEKSLEGIEGMVSARVHISARPRSTDDWNTGASVPRASASVLVQHRGATPPISADAIARLVAGSVVGLLPTDVAVIMVSRPSPPLLPSGGLGHVGPIAVARTSVRRLQIALVGMVVLIAGLAGATMVLYSRLVRARSELLAAMNDDRPAGRPR
jgi:type III secretion protein J